MRIRVCDVCGEKIEKTSKRFKFHSSWFDVRNGFSYEDHEMCRSCFLDMKIWINERKKKCE